MITHYQRLLELIKPTYIHIMEKGKIVKTGDISLAAVLEEQVFRADSQDLGTGCGSNYNVYLKKKIHLSFDDLVGILQSFCYTISYLLGVTAVGTRKCLSLDRNADTILPGMVKHLNPPFIENTRNMSMITDP
ncbi:ABC transporter I family member 6, chloroplastic-like protein [Drosera capensis]